LSQQCGEVNSSGRRRGSLSDLTDRSTRSEVRLAGQQVVDGSGEGGGVVEVFLGELEVGRVGQLPGGSDQLGVQPLGVGVGAAGTLPVAGVLAAQLLDVGPGNVSALSSWSSSTSSTSVVGVPTTSASSGGLAVIGSAVSVSDIGVSYRVVMTPAV
jgi:hypothetical protein